MCLNTRIITLDWDNVTLKEAKKMCGFIYSRRFVKGVQLRQSPMKNGFHVYIKTYPLMTREEVNNLRIKWADDIQRVITDLLYRPYFQSVLFTKKVINGIEHKDLILFTWNKD